LSGDLETGSTNFEPTKNMWEVVKTVRRYIAHCCPTSLAQSVADMLPAPVAIPEGHGPL